MSREFVDVRNYPCRGIPMTLDDWTDFITGGRHRTNPNFMYDRKRLEWGFEHLQSSPQILGRFLSLPKSSQRSIVGLSELCLSIPAIIGYTNVFHRLGKIYPKIEPWRLAFHPKIASGMRGFRPNYSKEMLEKSGEFIHFQNTVSSELFWKWCSANYWIVLVLVPIYGEQRVMRAIDVWIQNTSTDKIEDFLTLVECIDDFDENYPIEWSLSVVTSDLCSRLLIPDKRNET